MILQEIEHRWQAEGVAIRPGLADADIEAFERRFAVRLPIDMRAFFRHMDGMEPWDVDDSLNSFWPLSKVNTVPALLADWRGVPDYGGIEHLLPDASSYFVFADHSIWVAVLAVRLTDDAQTPSQVASICGTSWKVVAPSFGAFLRLYFESPMSVF